MSRLLFFITLVLQVYPAVAAPEEAAATWIEVDTQELTLTVMRGEVPQVSFQNIAIGSNGVTRDKRQGDERTPLGNFRIADVRDSQRFVTFIAFDYPTADHIHRACSQHAISRSDCERLDAALSVGAPAPQNTALGGHLGIHGTGEGDPVIHASFNWTRGCVALTNEQLAELLLWVSPGMLVRVR